MDLLKPGYLLPRDCFLERDAIQIDQVEFVANLAREHDLEFHTESGDVAQHAAGGQVGVESAARELRYTTKTPEDLDTSVAALVRSVDDPTPEVRTEAIGALGDIVLTAIRPREGTPPPTRPRDSAGFRSAWRPAW